jgi:glycosyltransferase involved in cell wall biosynthesis
LVSVVIPVRNEAENLGALLEDLLSQDYPSDRYEILVADGESTDQTREVVERFARRARVRILCLPNPRRLSSAGRNVGVRASRGDFILFIDGHCRLPGPAFLRHTVRLFEETGADCLCRPQPLTAAGNTWFQDVVAHARATLIGHGRDSTIYATDQEGYVNPTSAGAAYRRSVFERVGMYDETFDACEDVDFNYRVFKAGLRSYLSSRAAVFYRPRSSLGALFKQLVRYGRGRVRFVGKHPDALTISQLVPAAFVAWLFLGAVGSLVSTVVAKVYLASLAIYGAVVLCYSFGLGLRYGVRELVVAPLVYVVVHTGLGAGFWAEAFKSLWTKPVGMFKAFALRRAASGAARRSSDSKE